MEQKTPKMNTLLIVEKSSMGIDNKYKPNMRPKCSMKNKFSLRLKFTKTKILM